MHCFLDVVGIPEETIKSHPASSYCDSKGTVGDTAADTLDQFHLVDGLDRSFSYHLTAEEMIKCAAETAALKQLSESLLVTSVAEAVTCTGIPYRDNEIDGAEDGQQTACEQSESTCSADTDSEAQFKAVESSVAAANSCSFAASLSEKTVAVAALPSGVYITKPSQPTDNKASATQASEDDDGDSGSQKSTHRLQLQKQFPLLHDLSQRPQQS